MRARASKRHFARTSSFRFAVRSLRGTYTVPRALLGEQMDSIKSRLQYYKLVPAPLRIANNFSDGYAGPSRSTRRAATRPGRRWFYKVDVPNGTRTMHVFHARRNKTTTANLYTRTRRAATATASRRPRLDDEGNANGLSSTASEYRAPVRVRISKDWSRLQLTPT